MRADRSGATRGGGGGGGRPPVACGTGSAPAASAAARARSSGCSGERWWVATVHAMSCARASGADRRLSPGVGVVVRASASVNPWSSSAADTAAAQASARSLCSRSTRSASAAAAACSTRRCSRAWARRCSATSSLTSQPPRSALTTPAGRTAQRLGSDSVEDVADAVSRMLVEQVVGDGCHHAEVEQPPAQLRIDDLRGLLLLFLLGSNNNICL